MKQKPIVLYPTTTQFSSSLNKVGNGQNANLGITGSDNLSIRELIRQTNHEATKRFIAMEAPVVSPDSLYGNGISRRSRGKGSEGRRSHESAQKEKVREGEELLVVKP